MDWRKISLDVNIGLVGSFVIGYRFTDDYDASDEWTNRFERFKQKRKLAVYGAVNLMKTAVPILMNNLGIDESKATFIPALSSSETVASEKGVLSVMARVCAKSANANFVGNAITKKPHHPLHLCGNAERRREILDEANYKSVRIETEAVLIFDDFITRGETLSRIARAIHKTNRGVSVYAVCLGKNESRSYLKQQYGIEISNDLIPKKWDDLWKQGEELYSRKQRKD